MKTAAHSSVRTHVDRSAFAGTVPGNSESAIVDEREKKQIGRWPFSCTDLAGHLRVSYPSPTTSATGTPHDVTIPLSR